MKRVGSFLLVISLVFLACRALVRTLPGDPLENILAETGTRISAQAVRAELGLDRPLLASSLRDLGRFVHGDFGNSILTGDPIARPLKQRLNTTLRLAFLTLIFALAISLPLGIGAAASAENPRLSWIDRLCTRFGAWMSALPTPWLGPVLMYLFAVQFPVFPIATTEEGRWPDFFLPALTLALVLSGLWCRLIRERVSESLFRGSAQAARARGISELRVLLKYGLAPVSAPLVAYLGSQVGLLLGGALVTETIFNLRGMGSLLVESVLARDYPVFEAAAFWVAFVALAGTYIGDWFSESLARSA